MWLPYIFILCQIIFTNALQKNYYGSDRAEYHFEVYKKTYNKSYNNIEEERMRYGIFKENLMFINEMNRRNPYAVFDIDQFVDMTYSELSHIRTGLNTKLGVRFDSCDVQYDQDIPHRNAPHTFDWRYSIRMNIKNQDNCNACWAFAATANVEAQYFLRYKKMISLSEQQLIDCDDRSEGCVKGVPSHAFRKLIQQGGQEEAATYPYVKKQQVCKFSPGRARVRITNCTSFNLRREETMKEVLFKHGPIVAAIDATPILSSGYVKGILSDCEATALDHAVLVVGYGTSREGKEYWILKNSWGQEWGENGFFKIQRGVNCLGILNPFMSTSTIM